MELKETIEKRRAYRALEAVEITEEMIEELAKTAQLAPSCFNKQPWRYVFIHGKEALENFFPALDQGNSWGYKASMIIAVVSNKDLDCIMKDGREYYQFDTGMATGFLLLKATEMGLVAHPIAGYDQEKAKEILKIPEEMTVITLIIVGKHSNNFDDLADWAKKSEENRPPRNELEKFVFINKYNKEEK